MKKISIIAAVLILAVNVNGQKNASVSFEKWISLKGVFAPIISPDGKTIVYTVGTTDWGVLTMTPNYGWCRRIAFSAYTNTQRK